MSQREFPRIFKPEVDSDTERNRQERAPSESLNLPKLGHQTPHQRAPDGVTAKDRVFTVRFELSADGAGSVECQLGERRDDGICILTRHADQSLTITVKKFDQSDAQSTGIIRVDKSVWESQGVRRSPEVPRALQFSVKLPDRAEYVEASEGDATTRESRELGAKVSEVYSMNFNAKGEPDPLLLSHRQGQQALAEVDSAIAIIKRQHSDHGVHDDPLPPRRFLSS